MDISTIANVATAITVLTGVIFGLFEVRHFRREREERAAFYLLQTMLTANGCAQPSRWILCRTMWPRKFSKPTRECSMPRIPSD